MTHFIKINKRAKNTRRYRRAFLTMPIVVAVIFCTTVRAEREVVDKVVAIIEDEAVFKSDVDQMVKQILVQRGETSAADRAKIEEQALQELVNSRLIIEKAKALNIDVTFSDVEKAVDAAIKENEGQLGPEAFERQLAAEGLTLESLKQLYREQIRNRMLVDRVLAREIDRAGIKITEAELLAAFEKRKSSLPPRPTVVHLTTIYLALDSSENAKAKAKRELDALRTRIIAGEDFGEIAKEHSDDPSAANGGKLGLVRLSDLANADFAAAAAKLTPGEVSDPVLTPFGYHLLQVTGVDTTSGQVNLRHILVRLKAEEADVEVLFTRANDIHAQLETGAPFDSLAIKYSDDTTAPAGGDLGWLKLAELPEFFRDVLKDLRTGELSPVLREPNGFRIVKLVEKEEERPYVYEEVQADIRKLVEQERLASSYDDYISGLRNEFFVEVHN